MTKLEYSVKKAYKQTIKSISFYPFHKNLLQHKVVLHAILLHVAPLINYQQFAQYGQVQLLNKN